MHLMEDDLSPRERSEFGLSVIVFGMLAFGLLMMLTPMA